MITASYFHEHGTRTEIPAGAYKPARALARRWGVPHRDVLTAAFLNRLGPASYQAGDVLLCPSLLQVHRALPGAALADVAREQQWPRSDTVAIADVGPATGKDRSSVRALALHGSGIARDATGKMYVRRSEVAGTAAEATQRTLAGEAPEYLALDPAGWTPLSEAVRAHPDLYPKQILERIPHVRPGIGHHGAGSVFVWLDPDHRGVPEH